MPLTVVYASIIDRLAPFMQQSHPDLKVIIKLCDLSKPVNAHHLFDELKDYAIETWINNAGFGHYGSVNNQDLNKIESMLHVNIEALTIFSTLYTRAYHDVEGAQLINISSRGGYTIVPDAVTYCATKFYVSAFTEGLAHELKAARASLKAKVLAPAATKTEFGQVANNVMEYDYSKRFTQFHTPNQMAEFLLALYDSEHSVGEINTKDFSFALKDSIFAYSGNLSENQRS